MIFFSQVLETIHGSLELNWVQPFSSELKELKEKVGENYSAEFFDAFANCVQHLAKPSRAVRLKHVLSKVARCVPKFLALNTDSFVATLVLTRNYYIHGTKGKRMFLDQMEQAAVAFGLRLAINVFLLSELQFPFDRLYATSELREWRSLAKAYLSDFRCES